MRKIVIISGKQGSGKTTIAHRVVQELWSLGHKAVRFKFADTLYQMHDAVRGILKRNGLDKTDKVDGYLLQLLGTEWGRKHLGPDIWVAATRVAVMDYWITNPDGIVVIDDCRFENEYKIFIGEKDVWVMQVRLVAPVELRKKRAEKWRDNESHESETGLDGFGNEWFDVVSDTSLESISSITGRIVNGIQTAERQPKIFA